MTVELFVFPPSPRSFKVMVTAKILGIDAALKPIDLIKGEQKTAEYAAINPNMRAPALRDGAITLWEASAIMQYLALKRPERGLLPRDEAGRLDVTRWQFWELAHWDPACVVFVFENMIKPLVMRAGEPDAAALAKGADNFHRCALVLDGHLKGRHYIVGDALTLADIAIGSVLNLAEAARLPLEPYGEIRRWHATLRALPAWQETLKQCPPPPVAQAA